MPRSLQTVTCFIGLLSLSGTGLVGCISVRQDIAAQIRGAMAEEPSGRNADSQWTTHSTSMQAVPSVGGPDRGRFGDYSQPLTR